MNTEALDRPETGLDPDGRLVVVELNGEARRIRTGEYTGRTLKAALDVPIEHELEQVIKGEFKPVANDQKIRIRGGEKFVSHCGQGQSS
jgi:hypothetical protein